MPWSDDISPVLVGLDQKIDDTVPFRQAYLLTFNAQTGANTVLCAGAILQNLPMLNLSGAVLLHGESSPGAGDGDVIIIMKMKSSWAIMGRVLVPAAPAAAVGRDYLQLGQGDSGVQTNFAVTTTFTTFATAQIVVPQPVTLLVGVITSYFRVLNNGVANNTLQYQILFDGSLVYNGSCAPIVGTGGVNFAVGWPSTHIAFNVTPGSTINVTLQLNGLNTFGAASASNSAQLKIATFMKTAI